MGTHTGGLPPWPPTSYKRATWHSQPIIGVPPPPGERKPYSYLATVPPKIANVDLRLPGHVVALCDSAGRAVVGMDQTGGSGGIFDFLLLRTESISSSKIEGIEIPHRKLAQVLIDPERTDIATRQVAGNVIAMRHAVELASSGPLTLDVIAEIHCTLFSDYDRDGIGGVWRQEQNWIGGSNYGPKNATYVPPPPGLMMERIHDLIEFANRDDIQPVAQAAIVHGHFEAIHPFVDGNGRVGRCLIHVILKRSGVLEGSVPPISTVLLADRDAYYDKLNVYAKGQMMEWVSHFAGVTQRAANYGKVLQNDIAVILQGWRDALEERHVRSHSVTHKVVETLWNRPVVSASTVANEFGIDNNSARRALAMLEEVGIVRQTSKDRRNRIWVANQAIDLLDNFESFVKRAEMPRNS